eukprot:scaffold21832_cov62-Phaeocystis_antarctica.AAC.7
MKISSPTGSCEAAASLPLRPTSTAARASPDARLIRRWARPGSAARSYTARVLGKQRTIRGLKIDR